MTQIEATLDALHTEERESALTFPCTFPIKIMGRTQDGFAQAVADVVLPARARLRSVGAGDARVARKATGCRSPRRSTPTSREQLDNLYRELVAHPMVKMVL